MAGRQRGDPELVTDVALWAVPAGIISGRPHFRYELYGGDCAGNTFVRTRDGFDAAVADR